jgi:hypothetical protein
MEMGKWGWRRRCGGTMAVRSDGGGWVAVEWWLGGLGCDGDERKGGGGLYGAEENEGEKGKVT